MLGLKNNENSLNFSKTKNLNFDIKIVLSKLIDYLCIHIKNQLTAGSDVVQVFDSWAGLLPVEELNTYCYEPNFKITEFCKEKKTPIICFPKGIKEKYLEFQDIVKPDGLNLDYDINPEWAKENLTKVVLQGGMHPQFLLKSVGEMNNEAKKYLDIFRDVPYIFNLGHGIVPETSPAQVEKLIEFIRNYK